MENSLGGFEFLTCIPGTVGESSPKMNAGCFQHHFTAIGYNYSKCKQIRSSNYHTFKRY